MSKLEPSIQIKSLDHQSHITAFKDFIAGVQENHVVNSTLFNLKQHYQMNSNVVLFLLWFAEAKHGRITKKDLNALIVAVAHWHERVLLALRNFSSKISGEASMEWLQAWVETEIHVADQMEQQFLTEALDYKNIVRSSQQQLADACHNLMSYCKFLKIQLDANSQKQIIQLLSQIFPNISLQNIHKIYEAALLQLTHIPHTGAQLSLGGL